MAHGYLAIDIGGTFVKHATIDHSGNIEKENKFKTPYNLEDLLIAIQEVVTPLQESIKGVGISCPGRVDPETGIIYNGGALPFLHEFSFKKFFSDRFGLECAVSNDGKAAALAELWLGNLKGVANGAAIVLGTGIGGGIIVDGKLVQGNHFQAGELSFLLRTPAPAEMENVIAYTTSAVYFIKRASGILHLADDSDGVAVFQAIVKKDNPQLTELFETYCREIAWMILNLQATLDSQRIVIGGGISAQEILIEEINRQYHLLRDVSYFFKNSFYPMEIQSCAFRSQANLLGAIYQLFLEKDLA
ncbi:ROK family protein [Enterococcus sp. HY326]|uniref:ROK family protein n=1 Tax=Enterococcus sp. HY326 TaxID=2971265 RepID=UPI002240D38E|nr:ROK family protein [Enterococcus sp. HY326]